LVEAGRLLLRNGENERLAGDLCRLLVSTGCFAQAWVFWENLQVGPEPDPALILTSAAPNGAGMAREELETVSRAALQVRRHGWGVLVRTMPRAEEGSAGRALLLPLDSMGVQRGLIGLVGGPASTATRRDMRILQALAGQVARRMEENERARLQDETIEELGRRVSHLSALRTIDIAITSGLTLEPVLNVVLEQVITHLDVDAAALFSLSREAPGLELLEAKGIDVASGGLHDPLDEATSRDVANLGHLVVIDDLEQLKGTARVRDLLAQGFRFYAGVPLVSKGDVHGMLEVFRKEKGRPDAGWVSFLQTLAGQAAMAIENARLVSELKRTNAELVQAYEVFIEGLVNALDLRDKETEGHTMRVARMTVKLGLALGFSPDEVADLRRGALLHDIGKMGIPDSILLKPGPLSEEEWAVMRMHPVYGYQLLKPIPYLKEAAVIPYLHHERWDGSGYPLGLKGEEIPFPARIFAVVDVWDALLSDRPYRRGWTRSEVLAYMRSMSGVQFDPLVVQSFLDLLEGEGTL
jgi:HD-GYP domain-containing protein (c-di-GMP phosphodiesterase class II)